MQIYEFFIPSLYWRDKRLNNLPKFKIIPQINSYINLVNKRTKA